MNEEQKWLPKGLFCVSQEHEARKFMKPRRSASAVSERSSMYFFNATTDPDLNEIRKFIRCAIDHM